MLIACKCLNILLRSINSDLPTTTTTAAAVSVNVDGNCNQIHAFNNQLLSADGLPATMTTSTRLSSSIPSAVSSPPQLIQECTAKKLHGDYLHFFKTANIPSSSLLSVLQQPDLIHVTLIEHWNVYLCVHCKTITHAQSDETNGFLVNPTLLASQENIDILRNDENFSRTFGILILNNSKQSGSIDVDSKNRRFSSRVKGLRKLLFDAKKKEMDETEARIARYTEQQTNLLKKFCEKAEQDYQDIISVLDNVPDLHITDGTIHNETITGSMNANAKLLSELTPPVTPDSAPMSIGNSPNFKQQTTFLSSDADTGLLLNKKTNFKAYSHSYADKTYQKPNAMAGANPNADADIFFDMDGIDSTSKNHCVNHLADVADYEDDEFNDEQDEQADTVDTTKGIRISSISQRQRLPKGCVAQSLPMAVPIFNHRSDDDYDEEYAEDNVDIAASIKALAKSVHGEAIFGDLPRPRFSTQI